MKHYFQKICLFLAIIGLIWLVSSAKAAGSGRILPKIDPNEACDSKIVGDDLGLITQDTLENYLTELESKPPYYLGKIHTLCFDPTNTAVLDKRLTIAPKHPLIIHGLDIQASDMVHIKGEYVSLQNVHIDSTWDRGRSALFVEGRNHSFYDLTLDGHRKEKIGGIDTLKAQGMLLFEDITITNFDYGMGLGGEGNRLNNVKVHWEHDTDASVSKHGHVGIMLDSDHSKDNLLSDIQVHGYAVGIQMEGLGHTLRGASNISGYPFSTDASEVMQTTLSQHPGSIGVLMAGSDHSIEARIETLIDEEAGEKNEVKHPVLIEGFAQGVYLDGSNLSVTDAEISALDVGIESAEGSSNLVVVPNLFSNASATPIALGGAPLINSNSIEFKKGCSVLDENGQCMLNDKNTHVKSIIGVLNEDACYTIANNPDTTFFTFTFNQDKGHVPYSACEKHIDECKIVCEQTIAGQPMKLQLYESISPYLLASNSSSQLLHNFESSSLDDLENIIVPGAVTMTPIGGNAMNGSAGAITMTPVGDNTGLDAGVVGNAPTPLSNLESSAYVDDRPTPTEEDSAGAQNSDDKSPPTLQVGGSVSSGGGVSAFAGAGCSLRL